MAAITERGIDGGFARPRRENFQNFLEANGAVTAGWSFAGSQDFPNRLRIFLGIVLLVFFAEASRVRAAVARAALVLFRRRGAQGNEKNRLIEKALNAAPILFRGTPTALGTEQERTEILFLLFGVFLGRSEVFEILGNKFGADAVLQQADHFNCAREFAGCGNDGLANFDGARGFDRLFIDLDFARGASGCGLASRFEKPHRPKPFIHSDRLC